MMANKQGTAHNDTLIGTAQADLLMGLAGNDTLNGLGGDDKLFGGDGVDVLIGGAGNDYLDGGAGDDDLRGGAGNDTYAIDNAHDITLSLADPGHDLVRSTITYTLGPQQEDLTLLGKAALNATGNAGDNVLIGNDGANVLNGMAGNDTLVGGKGIDILRGGAGDDLYIIDNAHEIETGRADPGNDQVQTTVNYTLGPQQESLVLVLGTKGGHALTGTGNEGDNFILGNEAANVLHGAGGDDTLQGGLGNDNLFGDDGNDTLDGQGGIDHLHGGNGDDTYTLDDGAEIDKLEADPGTDTVFVNFDYTLGANQERLAVYHLDGQTNVVTITANDQGSVLFGSPQADVLLGGAGNDTLVSGGGLDHLEGRGGNDVYFIDDPSQIDKNVADDGIDQVNVAFSYALGAQQEQLVLSGSADIDGTGNEGQNFLQGNAGANLLSGLGGDDRIVGGGGADTLLGGAGNDVLQFQADAKLIDGGAGIDTLFVGGAGASVTLDLTLIDAGKIQGMEAIGFALDANHPTLQTFTLVANAADVLALSDTTNLVEVFGESGDSVHLTGGGWARDPTLEANLLAQDPTLGDIQAYSNGAAALFTQASVHVEVS